MGRRGEGFAPESPLSMGTVWSGERGQYWGSTSISLPERKFLFSGQEIRIGNLAGREPERSPIL